MNDLLYVGTYTDGGRADGIYIVRMSSTGELRIARSTDAGPNPSFVCVHPNRHFLYCVNEVESGSVSAFAIDEHTGALTKLNEQPSEGGAPCYVCTDRDGQVLVASNYAGGTVAMFEIEENGQLAKASSIGQLTRAHCIVTDPSNRFALVADIASDRVSVFTLNVEDKSLNRVEGGEAVMRAGAGPRHIAFHPTLPIVFVANELDSTVTSLHFDSERAILSPFETLSTLPSGWSGTNYPADIHVAPDGRTLYVSNRGHNSIAVFSVFELTGRVVLDQLISTDGDWPRNFAIDPSGRWLLVANQRSDSVIVFERDDNSGRLELTQHRLEIPRPACIQFLDAQPIHN